MLAAQGYCVVQIDSRGSQHRGLLFESHLRGKMVCRNKSSALSTYITEKNCVFNNIFVNVLDYKFTGHIIWLFSVQTKMS